jgi:DNA-directed RNA polymerase specialized sigma24 family protein
MGTILKEKDYNDLYKYSLNIAYKFVGYEDSAYDIAQNSMLQLISAKTEITSPYAWLRTVVKRESLKLIEEKKKIKEITVQRHLLTKSVKQIEGDTDAIPTVDDAIAKKALSVEDYRIYQKLKKIEFNIQKYSEKEKMSYNTASFQKKRIKRNLLSFVLWNDGWRDSTKVLNFAQFNNITRFIRTIIKAVEGNSVTSLINYLRGIEPEKVTSIFNNISKCCEWSISYEKDHYQLFLACLTIDEQLKVPRFDIHFDKKNYLHVLSITEGEVQLIENDNPDIDLENYREKGRITLSLEELLDLLKYSK